MNKIHRVEDIAFTRSRMLLTVDGKGYSCVLGDVSDRLARASEVERERCEVSPSGYGIHWPLVDEDLTVDGLLRMARPEPEKIGAAYPHVRSGKVMAVAEKRAAYGARNRKQTDVRPTARRSNLRGHAS